MNWSRTLTLASAVVSMLGLLAGPAMAGQTYVANGKTVVVNVPAPTVLPVEQVYYVPPSVVNATTIKSLVAGMGFDPNTTTVREPSGSDLEWEAVLSIGSLFIDRNTGALWYQKKSPLYSGQPAVPTLLSQEQAISTAKSFLSKYKLLPSAGLVVERVNRTLDISTNVQGTAESQTAIDQVVVFRRSIDGLLVQGPGSTIRVRLGHKGEIIGFYLDLRPYGGQPTLPSTVDKLFNLANPPAPFDEETIDTTSALAEFVNNDVGAQELQLGTHELKTVEVNRMALVYYAKPGPEPQTWLAPAYAYEGRVVISEGSAQVNRPFLLYRQALQTPPEPMFAADQRIQGMNISTFSGTFHGAE